MGSKEGLQPVSKTITLPLCAAGLSDLSGKPIPREYTHSGGSLQSSGGGGREESAVYCHGTGNIHDWLPQCVEPLKQCGKFSDILFTSEYHELI